MDALRRKLATAEGPPRRARRDHLRRRPPPAEPQRAAARAVLSLAPSPVPGTRAAALLEFLRTHEDPITPPTSPPGGGKPATPSPARETPCGCWAAPNGADWCGGRGGENTVR
jgi:hypothetical protein